MDVRRRIDIGKGAGGGDAVFQREAGARWRLRPVGKHPPVAVRSASDFECQEVQIVSAGRLHAHQRPQVFRIGRNQRRRYQALADQPAIAIDIGDDLFQKVGALNKSFRERLPLAFVDEDGNVRDRPMALARSLSCCTRDRRHPHRAGSDRRAQNARRAPAAAYGRARLENCSRRAGPRRYCRAFRRQRRAGPHNPALDQCRSRSPYRQPAPWPVVSPCPVLVRSVRPSMSWRLRARRANRCQPAWIVCNAAWESKAICGAPY